MKFVIYAEVAAVWITVFSTLSVPVSDATDNNNIRKLPRLSSFYPDDGSCSEHIGETTQRVIWNGRSWNLTAPESLVSPLSETKRNGTDALEWAEGEANVMQSRSAQ